MRPNFLALEACLAIWLEEISVWFVVLNGDIFVHLSWQLCADNLAIYIWCIAVKCCMDSFIKHSVTCYFCGETNKLIFILPTDFYSFRDLESCSTQLQVNINTHRIKDIPKIPARDWESLE